MVLVRQRTQLKNRIHATVAKYALHDIEASDVFGVRGRALLRRRLDLLPPHTAYATQRLLEQVENLDRQVRGFERRIQGVFKPTPAIQPLLTLPGVGLTLPVVIALAVGDDERVARRKGHAKAIGAVARHLAEATYWNVEQRGVLSRAEGRRAVSSTGDQRGGSMSSGKLDRCARF
jgi:transposase